MTTKAVATTDFTEIERLASEGALAFQGTPSIGQAMQLAETVEQLRAQLTPERMAKIKALMNTSLGFDTDRNPAKWTKPEPCVPYSDDVIRDVFIEATLRGFYSINKEYSIIAGNFYGGVNGFERLVKKHAKVTDFKDNYGIPTMGNGGAIIKCSATWKQDGEPQSLERDFAVRVNSGMGADAIVGKAKRKLFAAVYGRLSGVVTPDGEAGDDDLKASATAAITPAASKEQLFGARPAAATGTPAPAQEPTVETKPLLKKPPETTAAVPQNTPPAGAENSHEEIARVMKSSGVTFDDFRDFIAAKGLIREQDKDSLGCYGDVPVKVMDSIKAIVKLQAECIRTFGTLQKK
jgi:hypothetical protein